MVIMQKGNRQIRAKDSDVDFMKAKGYVAVQIADEDATGGEADNGNRDAGVVSDSTGGEADNGNRKRQNK